MPELIKDEFEAFLECGILALGFMRLRCADRVPEMRVAFSFEWCAVYDRDGRPAVDHAIQRGVVVAYLYIGLSVAQDRKADVLFLRLSDRSWPAAAYGDATSSE